MACRTVHAAAPMLGTASRVTTYVVVECPRPWNSKIQKSSGFPLAVLERLEAVRPHLDFTIVGVADPGAGLRVLRWFEGQAWERRLAHPEELEATLTERPAAPSWTPDPQVALVCTHGSRDPCCATVGVPLLHALRQAGIPALECSHLGGHRFAPTVLLLPEWRMAGRLTPDQVDLVRGPLPLDYVRGLGYLSEPAQVAEAHISERRGCRPSRVEVLEHAVNDAVHSLRLRVDGQEYQAHVTQEACLGGVSCCDLPDGPFKTYHTYTLLDLSPV